MKKMMLLIATCLACGGMVIAENNNKDNCWVQDKNGNYRQGQYRGTEQTITTNSNTNRGSSARSDNKGTSEGTLGTSTKLSGTMERTESSNSSKNHETSVTISEKRICVPNEELQKENNK